MAKKSRVNGEKYKRAIEYLFAKKLNARDVELSLDKISRQDHFPSESDSSMRRVNKM